MWLRWVIFFFNLFESWYLEADGRLPNDFSPFPVKLAFYKTVAPAKLDKAFSQILGGLPCCAPARGGKRLSLVKKPNKCIMDMFVNYKISHFTKQNSWEFVFGKTPPPLDIRVWRGTTYPMWSNKAAGTFVERKCTDGATEEKHALKGVTKGVTTLDSLSHASTVTDVLSPCPACNVPKPSLGSQWRDCIVQCVWVRAHESTCVINHWNPPHQSLTNTQHPCLVPEGRMWAKCLN